MHRIKIGNKCGCGNPIEMDLTDEATVKNNQGILRRYENLSETELANAVKEDLPRLLERQNARREYGRAIQSSDVAFGSNAGLKSNPRPTLIFFTRRIFMNSEPKFLVVIAGVEGMPFGTPEVVKFDDYEELQRRASDATGGAGGYRVLAEIAEDFQTVSKTVSDCDAKKCAFYTHYQLYYQPSDEFPHQLQHEAFHQAEAECEAAQNRYLAFIDDPANADRVIPEHLENRAAYCERRICA